MNRIFLLLGSENEPPAAGGGAGDQSQQQQNNQQQQAAPEGAVLLPLDDVSVKEATELVGNTNATQLFNKLKESGKIADDQKEFYAAYELSQKIVAAKADPNYKQPAAKGAPAQQQQNQNNQQQQPVKTANPLFGKGKAADVDFSAVTSETLIPTIKTTFGIDGDDKDILPKFLAIAQTQRNQASQAGQIKAELEQTKAALNGLPPQLAAAVNAATTGGDWQKALNLTAQANYTKSFVELSPEEKVAAISLLTGNEIKQEDLGKDENKNILATAAKYHELERRNIATSREAAQVRQDAERQNHLSQIEASVQSFQQEFPSMDSEAIDAVRKVITDPSRGIDSLFIEKYVDTDGRVKVKPVADIVKKVALVLFANEILTDLKNQQSAEGSNAAKQQMIEKSEADTKRDNNNNNQGAEFKQFETSLEERKNKFIKKQTY